MYGNKYWLPRKSSPCIGHQVKLQEVDGGIISDLEVLFKPTSNVDLLVPVVEAHMKQFGRPLPKHR